mgnify:CR=1 FL=1|tara:strand:+ start:1743 stop:2762 length:1020 start_codon:yes stop_codon:yes gene_type:complete
MTQAAELAGYASNLQMFRNKIINGNFDVWQRGTNITISNSTNMYTADRWRFAGDAFTGFINRQQFTPGQTDVPGEPNYFFRWAVNTNPSGNMAFGQYIEDVRTLAGRTATLSLYLYASATIPANTLQIRYRQVTGGTGGTNNTVNIGEITTSWKKFTFQLNIPSLTGATLGASNASYLALEILSPSTHTSAFDMFIAQVQLEEGTVATPFEHRPIGMELSLCQRYYQKSYDTETVPGTDISAHYRGIHFSNGVCDSSTNQNLPFTVEISPVMRAQPTLYYYTLEGTLNRYNVFTAGAMNRSESSTSLSGIYRSDRKLSGYNAPGAGNLYGFLYVLNAEL